MRNAEKNVYRILVHIEQIGQRFGSGGQIGIGDIEQEPVRKNAARAGDTDDAGSQAVLLNFKPLRSTKLRRTVLSIIPVAFVQFICKEIPGKA